MKSVYQPWVEKYRPTRFQDIVLDKMNRCILTSIVQQNIFPNLLLYGPPGTGKTTTIINLAKEIHSKQGITGSDLIIHLNASDERGIETIRGQINQFVNSSTLFAKGTKIVVLDEVDYMTKSAQQALKCLIDYLPPDVRFCLICNYINRIDESIRDTFVRLRFNQLPQTLIIDFLENITQKEGCDIDRSTLKSIQIMHQSDIRSMINHIQTNHIFDHTHTVITDDVWKILIENANSIDIDDRIIKIGETFSVGIIKIIKYFANYIIRLNQGNNEFFRTVELILHHSCPNETHTRNFFVHRILKNLKKLNINH